MKYMDFMIFDKEIGNIINVIKENKVFLVYIFMFILCVFSHAVLTSLSKI